MKGVSAATINLTLSLRPKHGYRLILYLMKKMEIKIWSDVMCPFCYIGKRRFEHAL